MIMERQIRNALKCALYENRYAPNLSLKILMINCAG